MASLTVENYLKAAWLIAARNGTRSVTTGQLSTELNVAPGTVTSMLKTLAESGLAQYRPYEGMNLTPAGTTLALRMLRRHRLLELFLARTLSLTWDQVHEEAEHMEHAVSDQLIDRIDEFLGRPEIDPHGDPIPTADGAFRSQLDGALPLGSLAAGQQFELLRVTEQGPEFLRFLADQGLVLGSRGLVADLSVHSGTIKLQIENHEVQLSHAAANHLLVRPLAAE